jgi:imidazolonepropionase-like amidohydrolase
MTDIFPAPVSVENPLIPSFKQFPSSSLGAFWLLQTLFRAETYSGDLAKYFQNVSDALNKARKQEIPVIVKAQDDVDIGQAIRFAESVRMPLIVRGIPVSPSLIRLLKERDIPVVAEVNFQPDGMAEPADSAHAERGRLRMKNIPLMIDQGLRIALTATDEEVLPDLFWAAQYFRSHGRISAEKIIETITINPAEIFGVGDRIGSLASGKDADILFFKKKPGLPFPVLEKVMSQGRMVYEKK